MQCVCQKDDGMCFPKKKDDKIRMGVRKMITIRIQSKRERERERESM